MPTALLPYVKARADGGEQQSLPHVLDELGLTAVVGADTAELAARYTTAGFTVRSTGGTHHTLTRTPNPTHSSAADR